MPKSHSLNELCNKRLRIDHKTSPRGRFCVFFAGASDDFARECGDRGRFNCGEFAVFKYKDVEGLVPDRAKIWGRACPPVPKTQKN